MEIEFPTGDFIYVDLGPYSVVLENTTTTILRSDIFLNPDLVFSACLTGLIQVPGTVFTYRIIHPVTGHIVTEDTFLLDDHISVGSTGGSIPLSQLIASQDLLPASLALTQSQSISIEGTLVIDQDYSFGSAGLFIANNINLRDDASIVVNPNINLEVYRGVIYGCENRWDRIKVMMAVG